MLPLLNIAHFGQIGEPRCHLLSVYNDGKVFSSVCVSILINEQL
jgi:hypothetical protein